MNSPVVRRPPWLRKKLPLSETVALKAELRKKRLHTVCESARCPNLAECFSRRTATLMILGDVCNRTCAFCNVPAGKPLPPDPDEPMNSALIVKELGLAHAVITSVTRDDLPDGGAGHFAATLQAMRQVTPHTTVELLIPDFGGNMDALETVLKEKPDILNHNIETVPSLYPRIRPQADFDRSLKVLHRSSASGLPVKSGIMVGLGERQDELIATLSALKDNGVSMVTIGQYLAPSKQHAQVVEYFDEEWFEDIAGIARRTGIKDVFAGPYVRSSYMADITAARIKKE